MERGRQDFTVGVEEEVMLLDRDGWGLDQGFPSSASGSARSWPPGSAPRPTRRRSSSRRPRRATAAAAAAELESIRSRLVAELAPLDRAVAGAGTHPFVTWDETRVSPERRYRYLHDSMRELARREPTFAMHVHVAIGDPEVATATLARMRVHLPLLLALSANSPFWQGRDSGMASTRTPIFQAFPRSGIPRVFGDYRDYVAALETLIACGAFPEPGFIWWDLRLQPRFGTIEVRVMDTQAEAWRAGALTALTQSLVRLEALEAHAPAALVGAPELLEENRFRAARDGVRASCWIRSAAGASGRRDRELAVEACRPHARELGCEHELDQVEHLVAEPADQLQRSLAGEECNLERVVSGLSGRFANPLLP